MAVAGSTHPQEKPICSACGSDDVLADGYAAWDVDAQKWVLTSTFDKGSVCNSCGGDCSLKWVELPDDSNIRHDIHGFYRLSLEEAEHEDAGNASVGFDGRTHYATIEEARGAT